MTIENFANALPSTIERILRNREAYNSRYPSGNRKFLLTRAGQHYMKGQDALNAFVKTHISLIARPLIVAGVSLPLVLANLVVAYYDG